MSVDAHDARHQALREALGPLALGHLARDEAATLRAHVDGCAACREELAQITPLVARLDTVDPDRLEHLPAPPAGLGGRIHATVAHERTQRHAEDGRHREVRARGRARGVGRLPLLGAAAALVAVALVGGLLLGRATAPAPAVVPLESITLAPTGEADVTVDRADLVAHTWGVELRLVGAGFEDGDTFRAAFRDADTGELTAAGEFLGTGSAPMTCFLQSAALRDDVSEVVVSDASGTIVLRAAL